MKDMDLLVVIEEVIVNRGIEQILKVGTNLEVADLTH